LAYVERIVGDFTLAKRAAGFDHVLMVGTGTGLAPFVSMVKQLDREAGNGKRPAARYTLPARQPQLRGARVPSGAVEHREIQLLRLLYVLR